MANLNYDSILRHFRLKGTVAEVRPLGNGLINETLIVKTKETDAPDYVLQRINNAIFTDVDLLQRNIENATEHIREKLRKAGTTDIDRKVLTLVPTDEGKTYYYDASEQDAALKGYWRITVFIPRSVTKEAVNPDSSRLCGKAFGQFQAMLSDIKKPMGESIPDFHNMELRLRQLRDAVKADAAGRVAQVGDLIDEIERRAESMTIAERLFREGRLPKRICHCDTKVNNMLFDEGGDFLCVIDLDTIMPSFIFSDYGDFLRTAANTVAEDSPEIEKVHFRMDIFKAFTEGYLESAKAFLTDIEIQMLPYAVKLFPYMQAARFLTDYINGDTYYRIQYPEHNLVRTKNQIALLHSIEDTEEEIEDFIRQF